jgi:hypothetical protein
MFTAQVRISIQFCEHSHRPQKQKMHITNTKHPKAPLAKMSLFAFSCFYFAALTLFSLIAIEVGILAI